MPSPLARRGAAERAYLQGQLRAESLRRRKQEQHNADRKLREHDNDIMMPIDDPNGDSDSKDGQIQVMVEKRNDDPLSLATSPPTILHKFKRSVSAVLADSGIAEDGNLLFFPSGVPLLDEEDEIAPNDVHSLEGDHDGNGVVGGDARYMYYVESRSLESSTDDNSPSLLAADVILQLGACDDELVMTNPPLKKVTLRPKMNATNNNFTTLEPQSESMDQAAPCNSSASHVYDRSFLFPFRDGFRSEGGEVLNGSESFRSLSLLGRRLHSSFPRPIGTSYRPDSTEKNQSVGDEILNSPESYKQLLFYDSIGKGGGDSVQQPELEHHNANRKLGEKSNDIDLPMSDFDDATDGQIHAMIEKFKSGFADLSYRTDDGGRNHNHQHPMSLVTSPPTILQKSFKRSVSAVLANSGIAENGNLLFFPSGVPLLDEDDDVGHHDNMDCAFVMDTDSPIRKSEVILESGSAFDKPPPIDGNSPSLVAADIIWQLGASDEGELVLTNPLSKKVTLRPKMNATNNNNNTHGTQLTRIESGVSNSDSPKSQLQSPGQATSCIGCTSHATQEDQSNFLQVSNSSESFRQLSLDDKIGHCANFEGHEIMNVSESLNQLYFPNELRFRTDSTDRPDLAGGGQQGPVRALLSRRPIKPSKI
ncbi:hypothetical protein ACHAXA_006173 [Cyclostephanos tholiformis]|uniref:Uncharacterized protein n=1 Tax=Cyclostephanos tholiformis TaxID=382380 RepID=A0ABD3R5K8_9STRA